MHTHMHVHIYIFTYAHTYTHTHTPICTYTYTYRQTDIYTHTHTHHNIHACNFLFHASASKPDNEINPKHTNFRNNFTTSVPINYSLSLSLSLSHTHTHTHIHVQTHILSPKYSSNIGIVTFDCMTQVRQCSVLYNLVSQPRQKVINNCFSEYKYKAT